jgi:L-lactate dehydrogenase complex protein LldG
MKIVEALKANGVEVIITEKADVLIKNFENAHISYALSADEKTGVIFFGGFEEKMKAGLAEHHIAVLNEMDVKENILLAYEHARRKSDVLFASSSASKTADIEGKTVFGMHGPRKFTVVLVVRK